MKEPQPPEGRKRRPRLLVDQLPVLSAARNSVEQAAAARADLEAEFLTAQARGILAADFVHVDTVLCGASTR